MVGQLYRYYLLIKERWEHKCPEIKALKDEI